MIEFDFSKIKVLVLDVDGVLTDGGITYGCNGEELKTFDVKDGAGLKYWKRAGGRFAVITGRASAAVERRARELDVDCLHQGCKNKLPALEQVIAELGVDPSEIAVVGDDLPDLPMMHVCGFAACPADAVGEVRETVNYICKLPGGKGCVREVIELILKNSGRWDALMQRYLPVNRESK